ncbi:ankyrin repeat domain-containing protein SOWAHA [Tachysurus ichikawai]
MALTQDAVLLFLMSRGGKVTNPELVSAFTTHINCSEPEERRRNRDLFKSFINNVAVVKRVDDVKYVVVKKKYQEMFNAGQSSIASSSSSPSSSSSSCITQQRCFSKCDSVSITSADVLNNNSCFCTSPPGCYIPNSKDFVTKQKFEIRSPESDAVIATVTTSNQEESLSACVLNVANNTRKGQMGAVFAVVAIKSPPSPQAEKIKLNHRIRECQQGVEIPQQQEFKTLKAGNSSPYLIHESDLNKSPRIKRRQTAVPSSPAPKRGNKADKPGFIGKKREPREHEWLVKSATGRWSQIYNLLLEDAHLADKRNFISGFTVLHWAAKHGNSKMVRKILDVGKRVDVNIKSHDGYTPLHVAAIHSHVSVLNLLVRQYGASCNVRDNSGKKAYQYLHKDLSAGVRELLGDPAVLCQDAEHMYSDYQHFSDMSKNHNTFSKLFQAGMGYRKKSRHQSSFRLIRDEQEEKNKDCTLGH